MIESADERPDVDVVVIGGGVNGTGVARDCSLRGLRVALFERNDLAFGAQRQLQRDDPRRPALPDLRPRRHRAPRAATPGTSSRSRRISCSASRSSCRSNALATARGSCSDALRRVLRALRQLPAAQARQAPRAAQRGRAPSARAGARRRSIGGITFDEWGIDGARLCIGQRRRRRSSTAPAFARAHDVDARSLRRDDGRVSRRRRARSRDRARARQTSARVVVNATGAWAPITASLAIWSAGAARLRPGKGIHVFLDRRLDQLRHRRQRHRRAAGVLHALAEHQRDRHDRRRLLRRSRRVLATEDEVRYLVRRVERVFPAVAHAPHHRHLRRACAPRSTRCGPQRGRALARARESSITPRTAPTASTR